MIFLMIIEMHSKASVKAVAIAYNANFNINIFILIYLDIPFFIKIK